MNSVALFHKATENTFSLSAHCIHTHSDCIRKAYEKANTIMNILTKLLRGLVVGLCKVMTFVGCVNAIDIVIVILWLALMLLNFDFIQTIATFVFTQNANQFSHAISNEKRTYFSHFPHSECLSACCTCRTLHILSHIHIHINIVH